MKSMVVFLLVGFRRMRRKRIILLSVLAAGQVWEDRGIKSKIFSMQYCYTNLLDSLSVFIISWL